MSQGQINIWRMDVLKATVEAINDFRPMTQIKYVPIGMLDEYHPRRKRR